jgi:RNA polymerase sigma factor (sigma-70 family)
MVAWETLAAREHREPSVRELAREMNVATSIIEQLQGLRHGHRTAEGDLPARPAPISIEERLTVLMAVEELSARERTVVLGTFAAGLSQTEIALTLGLSQSQVSKILSRALGKLHQRVA